MRAEALTPQKTGFDLGAVLVRFSARAWSGDVLKNPLSPQLAMVREAVKQFPDQP